ncbi:MAG: NACHT domain-containing NTPase [Blastocatellales bacterium]
MDFSEPFEDSLEIARNYLAEVDAPLILVGVTDDTVLRDHFIAELRKRLGGEVELRDFHYDPQSISLVEGALAVTNQNGDANGHRLAVSAVGLEALTRDKQSEAIKLLNAQRNSLGYARLIVLLWLNRSLYTEVARKSYDFYSWSSHTFFLEPPAEWNEAQRLDSLRRSYLQAIVNQNEYVNLAGLAPMRGGQIVQMRMDEIFVPLCVEQDMKSLWQQIESLEPASFLTGLDDSSKTHYARAFAQSARAHDLGKAAYQFETRLFYSDKETSSRKADISELFRQRRAIVLGDPGAGKTTMLRYAAYRLALSLLNGAQSEPEQGGTLALPGDYLPVYVRVGLYAQHLKDHPDATIADFAPRQDAQLPLTEELLQDAMQKGKVLFLLDGLDEIIATSQRREVAQAVDAFAREHPDCPVIVTSRVVGYREAALSSEFEQFTIRPFDDEEIKAFINHWHEAVGQPELAASLIETIERQEPIRKLASNPLLLTVTALIHLRNVKLPNRRVELYQKAAETLVDNWMSARRVTPDDWDSHEALTNLLPAIAWRLHTESSGGLIGQDDLQQLLVETMQSLNPRLGEQDAHTRAAQFRRNVSEFSGIFLERGLDEAGRRLYGFLHLTFEEYLAAIKLRDEWKREHQSVLARQASIIHSLIPSFSKKNDTILTPLLHNSRWKEVILLCAGNMDQFDATQFIGSILNAGSEYEPVLHRDLFLAAQCLADDVRVDPDLRRRIVYELIDLYFSPQSPKELKGNVKEAFAELAGTYANDDLIDELEKRFAHSKEEGWFEVVSALGVVGDQAATDRMIECLVNMLADSKWFVRYRATRAFEELGKYVVSDKVIEHLLGLLADSNEHVRATAVSALESKGKRVVTAQLIEHLYDLLTDDDKYVRATAASALGAIGEQAATERVIKRLFDLITDADRYVRAKAVNALEDMGELVTNERMDVRLFDLLADSEWQTRFAVARALGMIWEQTASEGGIECLLNLLSSGEWYERFAAATALGVRGEQGASEQVIERLFDLLADSKGEVRFAAAGALRVMGARTANALVIERLLDLLTDNEWYVRAAAAWTVGAIGEGAASERLIVRVLGLLTDREEIVRLAATDAVGRLSSKLRLEMRPEMTKRFLALARKRGKSDKVTSQRNAGYVALRNLLAADVE